MAAIFFLYYLPFHEIFARLDSRDKKQRFYVRFCKTKQGAELRNTNPKIRWQINATGCFKLNARKISKPDCYHGDLKQDMVDDGERKGMR